MLSQNKYFDT